MRTVIVPPLVDTVDVVSALRSYPSGMTRNLRVCQVERWGLRTESPTPEDPAHDAEISWVIPHLNLRLTHLRPRSRHARGNPPELTAVRVVADGRSWRTIDLLLGLAAPQGCSARIVRSEEFAAAVAGRVLRSGDADLALCTVHRSLEELSRLRHDLPAWLTHHRIFEVWPPF